MVTEQKARFENLSQTDQDIVGSKLVRNAAEICQDEIEVTPEMVKAGTRELFYYHPDDGEGAETVKNIFDAMCLVHLKNASISRFSD